MNNTAKVRRNAKRGQQITYTTKSGKVVSYYRPRVQNKGVIHNTPPTPPLPNEPIWKDYVKALRQVSKP